MNTITITIQTGAVTITVDAAGAPHINPAAAVVLASAESDAAIKAGFATKPTYPAPGTEIDNCIYAGVCTTPAGEAWHLLVSSRTGFDIEAKLGTRGTDVQAATSYFDGLANTIAHADAGSELAQRVQALGEGFYIPSRAEALTLYACEQARALHQKEWYWTSTQGGAYDAWLQSFNYGFTYTGSKDNYLRCRPVRRLPLGSLVL